MTRRPVRFASIGRSVLTAWSLRRMIVIVLGVAGIGVLLYPSSASWFSDRAHAAVVSGYVDSVKAMTPTHTRDALLRAHEYNAHLPSGPVRDPYSASGSARESALGVSAQDYLNLLDGPDETMGVLSVPSIGLTLPIYHGTSADTLDRGIGHLYGTALPVGGPGTHSVLTGHSGVVGLTLFTNLHEVSLGDAFTVTVLDQTLTYRVDQISTVLPDHTASLNAVPGKDYVTLVTCTPIGVNTHRLLVRGVRVPTPEGSASQLGAVAGRAAAGFPWWILEAVGALVVLVLASTSLGRTR